jgi:hypothetical protein
MIAGLIDPVLKGLIQGGLLDTATLGLAFIYAAIRWRQANGRFPFLSAHTGVNLVHGLPLFPLLLLLLAGFGSDAAISAVVLTHRVILGAAAGVALFTILEM